MAERWLPGDVVIAADQTLWWRSASSPPDPPWRIVNSNSYHSEDTPVRPLTLLVRHGQPVHVTVTGPWSIQGTVLCRAGQPVVACVTPRQAQEIADHNNQSITLVDELVSSHLGRCDAAESCVVPHGPGPDTANQWHHFSGIGWRVKFHPECCPRKVVGYHCGQQHPDEIRKDA